MERISILVLISILNVAISIWNCYVVGTTWRDVHALGGGFSKAVLWCAVVQSGIGFSMPILIVLALATSMLLTAGSDPVLTQYEAKEMMQAMFSLWYIAVIVPIIGSGAIIWLHSVKAAIERRDFASIAAAGWNSFAQLQNMRSAWNSFGPAFDAVGNSFGKFLSWGGGRKSKIVLLIIALVILALIAGFLITHKLVNYFMHQHESRIDRHARHLRAKET